MRYTNYKTNKRAAELSEHASKKYGIIDGHLLRTRFSDDPMKLCRKEYREMKMDCIPLSGQFALNEFADLTEDEFLSKFTNINEEKIKKYKEIAKPLELKKNNIPKEVDWRKNGEIKEKDITKAKTIYVIQGNNEDDLKAAVAEKGPIMISLPGQHFRFYKKGIFDYWWPSLCKEEQNMLMTVVGFGKYCGIDYWLIKTPFGQECGENGYLMLRGGINTCQLTNFMVWFE